MGRFFSTWQSLPTPSAFTNGLPLPSGPSWSSAWFGAVVLINSCSGR